MYPSLKSVIGNYHKLYAIFTSRTEIFCSPGAKLTIWKPPQKKKKKDIGCTWSMNFTNLSPTHGLQSQVSWSHHIITFLYLAFTTDHIYCGILVPFWLLIHLLFSAFLFGYLSAFSVYCPLVWSVCPYCAAPEADVYHQSIGTWEPKYSIQRSRILVKQDVFLYNV